MISLRQRIRKYKINCAPWKVYKYEVERLPVSSQCLFSNNGISIDVLEMELKEDGWLFPDETLIECLASNDILLRKHLSKIEVKQEDFTNDWTQEDFENFYNNQGEL